MILYKLLADGLVGLQGAEEYAVRDDAGTAAALLQHAKEERQEEELCLFRIGDGFQIVMDTLLVHGAFEWRIGQADGVFLCDVILLRHAVLVVHVGMGDGVKHEIHSRDTKHGAVGVKAREGRPLEVGPLVAGHGVFVVLADKFGTTDQKSGCATGRITDRVRRRRREKLHHHVADVLRRAELAISSGSLQFPQHILVEIPLHVHFRDVMLIEIVEAGDDLLQDLGRRDEEGGVLHVPPEGRGVLGLSLHHIICPDGVLFCVDFRQPPVLHGFDGRENFPRHDGVDVLGRVILESAPPHGLPARRLGENLRHLFAAHVLEALIVQLLLIQRADEHQVRELLDDGQRIRHPAGPDVCPDLIYLILDRPCDHAASSYVLQRFEDVLEAWPFSFFLL